MIDREVKRARAIEEKLESRRSYVNQGSVEAKRTIPFTGDAVDTIYEIMHGRSIDYKNYGSSTSETLSVDDKPPLVTMHVEPETAADAVSGTKRLDSILIRGNIPVILEGARGRYYISDGHFSRITPDNWSKIKPFTEAMLKGGSCQFRFRIGEKAAAEFYYKILPALMEDPSFRIEEECPVAGLIPDEAEFVFYLDAEDGIIICEADVIYGDITERIKLLQTENLPLPAHRDMNQEMPVRDLLEELFDTYDSVRQAFLIEESDDARYELMKNGIDRLLEYGQVHCTDAFSAIRIKRTPSVQMGVSVESDLLELEILTKDMDYDELAQLLQSYRLKKKYHRLKSGQFIDLDNNESIDMLINLMESVGANVRDFVKGKIQIPAYRALYLDKMLEGHEELIAARDRHYRNLIRNFKTIGDAEFDLPERLDGSLRSYQEYGYSWLRTLEAAGFGGILADDMGLGKTIQAIAMLQAYRENHFGKYPEQTAEPSHTQEERDAQSKTVSSDRAEEPGGMRALVVCPASVVYNWTLEIERFAPELKTVPVTGTKAERRKILEKYRDFDVLVTSYDLLKRDIDLYDDLQFTHQILDEAQFIKNAKAVAAKSVKLVHASHRFALTGTPIENRLSELWSIFDYLMPGFLYGYEEFRKRFELPISKYGDKQATEALRTMIAPFILRRKKKDVLKDLPDKIEEIRYAHMESAQRRIYDAQALKVSNLIEEKGDINTGKIEILAELTRIRQICCDPNLLFADYDGGSAKREACLELVLSAADAGHKMLLFSQFTSMLSLLEEDLKREGIEYYKLTGETSKEERMRLVKAFNSDTTPVFLISLKAGGTGLNLTGADIVIHYDPWWNLAAQDQATDRAHRIGQTKDVTVFKLIAKDTIEEKIVKLQETKKELADAVLSGETRSLGAMSKEELLALLG